MPRRSDASWELSQAALDRLMTRLDPDSDIAGAKYEALHLTLSKFFDWRGAPAPDESTLVACFETCLDEPSDDARALILRYDVGKEREKIEVRVALARELALSPNALRSRAQRIRERLERCTGRCVRAREDADRDTDADAKMHTPAVHGRRGPSPRT